MAEKSDDIKQLFSHLGLNPSDYREIRSAPTANATVSEAPRRWSLLQSVPRAANVSISQAATRVVQAVPKPSALPPEVLAALPQNMPMLSAAQRNSPQPGAMTPPVVASLNMPPLLRGNPRDDLVSIFQAVGVPKVASQAADELPSIRISSHMASISRSMDSSNHATALPPRLPPVAPERTAPDVSVVVTPMSAKASSLQGAASGRLKLNLGAGSAGHSSESAESLQDVFRRLAGDNHV